MDVCRPALVTRWRNTVSAIGDRQMLPVHTKQMRNIADSSSGRPKLMGSFSRSGGRLGQSPTVASVWVSSPGDASAAQRGFRRGEDGRDTRGGKECPMSGAGFTALAGALDW